MTTKRKSEEKSHSNGSPTTHLKEHAMTTKHTRKTDEARPNDNATAVPTNEAEVVAASASNKRLPPGSRARSSVLREQAEDSIALGESLPGMKKGGWTKQKNQGLRSTFVTFDEVRRHHGDVLQAAKKASAAHDIVVDESLAVRDQLVAVVKIATQGEADPFANVALQLSPTTQNATELSNWFEGVIPVLKQHKTAITPYMPGDPVAIAEAQGRKLIAAQASYREARKRVSASTKKQRAAKVKLAAAIAEQRYAATIAFPRNKEVLSQFIPAWDKKRRVAKPVDPVSDPTEPTTASPSTGSIPPPPVTPEAEKAAEPEVKATPR